MRRTMWLVLPALIVCFGGSGCGIGEVDQDVSNTDGSWTSTTSTDADADTDTDADTDIDTETDHSDTPGDSQTEDTGVDCESLPEVELWMSPDDSNSMSSPVQVREEVLATGIVRHAPVRIHEFMNYYSYDYPPAPDGEVELVVELARDDDLPEGEYILQVGVVSEARTRQERDPLNLTLVLDTSCSMGGSPLDRMKDSCNAIAASLKPGDVVSLVTWSTIQDAVLVGHAVTGPRDPTIVDACDGLAADGGTDLHSGLAAGYAVAQEHYLEGAINRVVLVSDGQANVGVTDESLIGAGVGIHDGEGLYMAGIGVGGIGTGYNDTLMDTVTDLGRGASLYVPTSAEAERMFQGRFLEVFDVAARDVEMRLDLPQGFQLVQFSAEEVSTVREEIAPQHLAPNDAMVFYNHIHTPCPDVSPETEITVMVTYKSEVDWTVTEIERTYTFGELLAKSPRPLRRGAAVYAYAKALSEQDPDDLDRAYLALSKAEALYPADPELGELRAVLQAVAPQ
ncbi:MAG: VWA domain-containing protein [Myxococcales bacterium]|nr:VWA domain-containing protein [Myxococcales bacterium]